MKFNLPPLHIDDLNMPKMVYRIIEEKSKELNHLVSQETTCILSQISTETDESRKRFLQAVEESLLMYLGEKEPHDPYAGYYIVLWCMEDVIGPCTMDENNEPVITGQDSLANRTMMFLLTKFRIMCPICTRDTITDMLAQLLL